MHLCNQIFCTRGADLSAKDCQGFTPFMVAIETKQKDILRIMLNPNLNVLDANGQKNISVVVWALENDHVTLLQVC